MMGKVLFLLRVYRTLYVAADLTRRFHSTHKALSFLILSRKLLACIHQWYARHPSPAHHSLERTAAAPETCYVAR